MSGGAVAALVIGGVVVVGGGAGAFFYMRSRNKKMLAASQLAQRSPAIAAPQTANQAVGSYMTAVGPKASTTRTESALNTLEGYQHGLDNFVGNAAGGYVSRFLGPQAGNVVGGTIKGIAHYANPISVTKDVNKALGKISSKLNPAHWF